MSQLSLNWSVDINLLSDWSGEQRSFLCVRSQGQSNNEVEGIRWHLIIQTCPEARTNPCGILILPISTSKRHVRSLAPIQGGLLKEMALQAGHLLSQGAKEASQCRLWDPQEFADMVIVQRRLDVKVGEHRLLNILETPPPHPPTTTPGALRRTSGRGRYWQGVEVPQL